MRRPERVAPAADGARAGDALTAFGALVLLFVAATLSVLLVGVTFELREQLAFGAALLVAAIVLNRSRRSRTTHALVLLALLVTTRYMYWRATTTLVFVDWPSAVAGYALFGAEVYAYVITLLGYLQTIRPLRRRPVPLPADRDAWPSVDVLIPTYNEPLHVVAATVAGVKNLEWPREKLSIHLLDDGDRAEFRRFAAEAGIHYRTRDGNEGAKAGNLNAALAATRGELVAIFDCDHVPTRSFLQTTVGWFLKDENLAQLQTPHHFYNPDPIERNLGVHGKVPGEGSLFYGLVQDGNDLWNATFFCGSCAVMRRSALEEIGGIAVETVTEDAHTSLKLHRRGWDSAYLNVVQAAGLATETLAAHVNQRIRWARGLSQMLRIDNPLFGRGLTLAQRLCYLNAVLHFLYALPRLVFLLAPLCFLFFDLYVIQAEALMVAAMALPHLLHSNLTTARMHGRWRRAFWAEVYETLLSFYILLPTLVALVAPSRGRFNVTEKGALTDRDYFSAGVARPFVAIAALNLAGLLVGLYKLGGASGADVGTTWLNMAWASYNLVIVGVALSVAFETRQTRSHFRRASERQAWLATPAGHRIAVRTRDLSESGAAVTFTGDGGRVEAPYAAAERLVVDGEGGPISLPITVVADERPLLRLAFGELSIEERRALVGLLYSPGDLWLGALSVGRPQGALRSLFGILRFGASGWLKVIGVGRGRGAPRRPKAATRTATAATLALALLGLGSFVAVEPAAASTEAVVYEIDMLTDRVETPIELGLVQFGLRVPFAIRRDSVVEALTLSLELSYRDLSTNGEQRLRIRVNDDVVWRASGSSAERERVTVRVPGVALDEYDAVTFELERNDEYACAAASGSPFELVIHRDSRLVLDAEPLPIANGLDSLPLPFFDARDPRPAELTVVLAADADASVLRAAGGVAAWFGRLADYRGTRFDVVHDRLPSGNAVVVALGDAVPAGIAVPPGDGPSLTLVDNPIDPARQVLLVHATRATDLDDAVRRLVARTSAGDAQRTAHDRHSPTDTPYGLARWPATDVPLPLHALPDVADGALAVENNDFAPLVASFQLPGDFHESRTARHRLRVAYRYAPDLPDFTEELFVSINEHELAAVPLERPTAPAWLPDALAAVIAPSADRVADAHTGTLELTIPADLLRAENRLEFRFSAPPELAAGCRPAGDAGADSTGVLVDARILPGSTLTLEGGGHVAALPDLALFANSGMPFTRYADLGRTAVVLPPTPAEHEIALMLTVLGRLAAQSGATPDGLEIVHDPAASDRPDRIRIGSREDALGIASLLGSTPFVIDERGLSLDFGNPRALYGALAAFTTPDGVRERLFALAGAGASALPLETRHGVIAGARTPGTRDGTTLLLYAESEAASAHLARALTDRRRIGDLQGAAAVVGDDGVTALRTGMQYVSGDLSPARTAVWWLGRNVPVALALGALAALLFCLALPLLLDRVARRRLER